MSKTDKTNKIDKIDKIDKADSDLLSKGEVDEPTDTSFITNIKIDISASPDKGLSREKKLSPSDSSSPPKENSFINSLVSSKSSSRTTTLALDPRPYKKRERAYTMMIVILAVALVAQSALLWAMHLHHVSIKNVEKTNRDVNLERIVISGANLNQNNLESLADRFMRKYVGKSIVIEPKNERIALAEFAQGQIHIVQMTEPLSTEEKKQLESILGKPIREIYTQISALGVYVNNDSLLNELSLDELRKIYTGEISNGKIVRSEESLITTYKVEDNQFIDKLFQQKVMKDSQAKVRFNKLQEITSINSQTNDLFIGYGELRNLNLLPSKVKFIKIKLNESDEAIAPIIDNKLNAKYPLIYKTYWYAANVREDLLEFIIEEMKKQNDLK